MRSSTHVYLTPRQGNEWPKTRNGWSRKHTHTHARQYRLSQVDNPLTNFHLERCNEHLEMKIQFWRMSNNIILTNLRGDFADNSLFTVLILISSALLVIHIYICWRETIILNQSRIVLFSFSFRCRQLAKEEKRNTNDFNDQWFVNQEKKKKKKAMIIFDQKFFSFNTSISSVVFPKDFLSIWSRDSPRQRSFINKHVQSGSFSPLLFLLNNLWSNSPYSNWTRQITSVSKQIIFCLNDTSCCHQKNRRNASDMCCLNQRTITIIKHTRIFLTGHLFKQSNYFIINAISGYENTVWNKWSFVLVYCRATGLNSIIDFVDKKYRLVFVHQWKG